MTCRTLSVVLGAVGVLALAGCTRPRSESAIVFQSSRDGNFEIYSMRPDGGDQRRLTRNTANDITPCWSPDGSEIAFASDRDGNWEIYAMRADGSNARRLTNGEGSNTAPFWSRRDNAILFVSTRDAINGEIYRMRPDGRAVERLTRDSTVKDSPVASPLGPALVYTVNTRGRLSIAVLLLPDSAATSLTPPAFNAGDPAFSADGSRLLFVADRDGAPNVYRMTVSGTELEQLTHDSSGVRFPAATETEAEILFTRKGTIVRYLVHDGGFTVLSLQADSRPRCYPSPIDAPGPHP